MDTPAITIVGYLNIDINKYPNKPEETLPGGAAYFVCLAASLKNSSLGIVTTIGNDFPIEKLGKRVRLDGAKKVEIPASKSIQTYTDANDFSKRTVELFDGAAHLLKPEDIPEKWIQETQWIHIATMPPHIQLPFIEYLRSKNTKAVISTDTDVSFLLQDKYKETIKSTFSKADVVFMNRHEHELLQDQLISYPNAIVKKDSEGAGIFKHGKEAVQVKAPKVECIDATGAGDIFAGTFIAERVNGKSEEEALQSAVNQASYSVSQTGIDHLLQ